MEAVEAVSGLALPHLGLMFGVRALGAGWVGGVFFAVEAAADGGVVAVEVLGDFG